MWRTTRPETARASRAPSNRFRPICEPLEDRLAPATLTVTTTADSGPGSLREAILSANRGDLFPGLDNIEFNISGPGPHTITPLTALPAITEQVVIDGYTQPGAAPNTNPLALGAGALGINAVLQIEISGVSAGDANGLLISGGDSTVRGLVINRFFRSAVFLNSANNVIEGNFLGTDPTGMLDPGFLGTAVVTNGDDNRIGGTTPAARNLVAGTELTSLNLQFGNRTVVQGNYIGTTATGLAVMNAPGPLSPNGVIVSNNVEEVVVGGSAPGEGNLIAGFATGVEVQTAINTVVQGNFIGTNRTGDGILGNARSGVLVFNRSPNARIGGTTAGARNLISGNLTGVQVGGGGPASPGVVVQGNFIGTDASGTFALPNTSHGVVLVESSGVLVGGIASGDGAGNLISGNLGGGILVQSSGNVIDGNRIGTKVDGSSPLGNGLGGIAGSAGSQNNTVGGTTTSSANVIAHNNGDGVIVSNFNGTSAGNAILHNQIFGNTGLGINLIGGTEDAFGVTLNDTNDGDAGPNNLRNFPLLTGVTPAPTQTTITGTLNGTANTTFRLELFGSAAADPSGHGQGQTFLGFVDVTTNASGDAGFLAVVNPLSAGQGFVTATATADFQLVDHDGNPNTPSVPRGETSEFSAVFNSPPTVSDVPDQSTDEDTPTGAIAFTVGDAATPGDSLTVTAMSSSPALVPDANIVFGGSGTSRTVTVTPAADQSGTATITITVSDGSQTASDTFVVTVLAVNDDPTLSDVADQGTDEDNATAAIPFTVGDLETAAGALTVSATASNPTLVPNSNLLVGGSGANRTLTVTPVANRSGTATITITVEDGQGGTAVDTFTLTVTAVNDAPRFTPGGNQVASANSGAQTVAGWATAIAAGPADEAGQTLNFVVTNDNNTLFDTQPTVAADGTLTYTPAANASGSATVTVRLMDDGGTGNEGENTSSAVTFTITVQAPPPPTVVPTPPPPAPIPLQTLTVQRSSRKGKFILTVTNTASGRSFTIQLAAAAVEGGALVVVGDVNGDQIEDVVIGARQKRGPVRLYNGGTGSLLGIIPGGVLSKLQGAISLGLRDRSGDGVLDIVISGGLKGRRSNLIFEGATQKLLG